MSQSRITYHKGAGELRGRLLRLGLSVMGCKCAERGRAIVNAGAALARGQVRTAVREVSFVGRSLAADLRSQDTRRAMAQQAAARLKRK